MAIDPRTGREYVTALAQECHERYLRRQDERIAAWFTLPAHERAVILMSRSWRMDRNFNRSSKTLLDEDYFEEGN